MWWWRKVRTANITAELRDSFEECGEDVIALALANPDLISKGGYLPNLIRGNYGPALLWLKERRDFHARREDRLETLEIAILIFVVVGVIVESGLGRLSWAYLLRLL
jgi:hypothetical protein